MEFAQFRIARPTDKFEKIKEFYGEGLGLELIGSFEGHEGYDGVMYGLPDKKYHLEFTTHVDGSPCPAPTKDNLLVFYIPENPYWKAKGITIEDPDKWRIVLMNSQF